MIAPGVSFQLIMTVEVVQWSVRLHLPSEVLPRTVLKHGIRSTQKCLSETKLQVRGSVALCQHKNMMMLASRAHDD